MRKTYLVILGTVTVCAGVAMLALPGPGLIVILIGLAVLASAGVLWAARLLVRARERLPDPADEPEKVTLVNTTIARIDRHIEGIEAVEVVREENRVMREERFQEDLVTTDSDERPGAPAVDEILSPEVVLPPDHRMV